MSCWVQMTFVRPVTFSLTSCNRLLAPTEIQNSVDLAKPKAS